MAYVNYMAKEMLKSSAVKKSTYKVWYLVPSMVPGAE